MNEGQRQHQDAVAATVADLRALGAAPVAVVPPSEVIARVEATLAALAAGGHDTGGYDRATPVSDPDR